MTYKYPPMTPEEFERAQAHYQLGVPGFGRLIGVKWRQVVRYRSGESRIPETTARLIRTAINHDLEPEDIG